MRCIGNCFAVSLHVTEDVYPLKKLIILDLSFNINIINEKARLRRYKRAIPGEFIWAGDSKIIILKYGNAFIKVNLYKGKGKNNKNRTTPDI